MVIVHAGSNQKRVCAQVASHNPCVILYCPLGVLVGITALKFKVIDWPAAKSKLYLNPLVISFTSAVSLTAKK